MLQFINENIGAILATAGLFTIVGLVVYWNVSDERQEKHQNNLEPIHATCALDTTSQDQQTMDKLVDVTMNTSLGILEALLTSAMKKQPGESTNPVQAALHPDTVK